MRVMISDKMAIVAKELGRTGYRDFGMREDRIRSCCWICPTQHRLKSVLYIMLSSSKTEAPGKA
jgi:hypothetical protein